jgi:hypothetical protein
MMISSKDGNALKKVIFDPSHGSKVLSLYASFELVRYSTDHDRSIKTRLSMKCGILSLTILSSHS